MTPLLALFLVAGATSTPTVVNAPSIIETATTADVPFYSQFKEITSTKWQKVGCGVASLAMVIDYYTEAVPVNTLLKQGIASGAYLESVGWTYKGLIQLANKYGLEGRSYDLKSSGKDTAFTRFKKELKNGPVIASVHYKFDPKSTIPHLVVIDEIRDGLVYYNDPAEKVGGKTISTEVFLKAWKMRFIVVRPVQPVVPAKL
jgi:ABC-type bacteriocin/lantibiotic exporter with double-glycine peptidase domain